MNQRPLSQATAEELAAIEEIKQLKAQYCYCVDHKDWARWAGLFTPDARFDEAGRSVPRHPVTGERLAVPGFSFEFLDARDAEPEMPLIGRDAIRAFGETIAATNITIHRLSTPELDLTSATTAKAIWPMEDQSWQREGGPIRSSHGFGYYLETYERMDDHRWYIKTLQFRRTWIELNHKIGL